MGDVAIESKKREAATARGARHVLGSLRQSDGLPLKAVRRKHWPRVIIPTRRTIRKNKYVDYVGEYHLELLIKLGLLPVMVPVVEGTEACLDQYTEVMRGLLVVVADDTRIAEKLADTVLVLHEGRAFFFGPLSGFLESADPHIRQFLALDAY